MTPQEINDALDVAECCVHDQIKDPNERDHVYAGLKKIRALAMSETRLGSVAAEGEAVKLLRDIYQRGLIDGYAQTHDKVSKFLAAAPEAPK